MSKIIYWGNRMARGRTRKVRSSGVFTLLWSPFKHLFMASGNSAQKVGSTAGKIVKETMKGVEGVGSSFASHTNQAIRNITKGVTRRNKRR
jgi:hypothetical protein